MRYDSFIPIDLRTIDRKYEAGEIDLIEYTALKKLYAATSRSGGHTLPKFRTNPGPWKPPAVKPFLRIADGYITTHRIMWTCPKCGMPSVIPLPADIVPGLTEQSDCQNTNCQIPTRITVRGYLRGRT
ncbi:MULTISPECIES: hypothetical protein [unclassified Methanoregula]|uniref:hypothetical protein n=1 Tax=unclassified Methanoregula TaxID=2649730 RepID=UPI0009C7E9CE|nr:MULTISPECIES: hypothetical protein [unclassified Methanoregula]OPX64733.1 MAG: hypothetical protein A4E33_00703 [Methanoregula sp. PtaB.Bin085]OPY35203.1 MAG: hypothetical protein A4E34_00880 [Methanoregula sp. PtaU1.Bin006]